MSILSKVIGTTRILTNSKTLYGAYSEMKDREGDDEHLDFNAKHIPTRSTSETTQQAASKLVSQLGTSDSASGIPNNRKVLYTLNKIHNAMVHLGVTVEKIASHTAILVKNSAVSQDSASLTKVNATARINEHEFSNDKTSENDKKEQDGFIKKLAKTFTEVSLTRALLPLIAEALAPLVGPLVAILAGGAVAVGGAKIAKKIFQGAKDMYEPGDQRPPGYREQKIKDQTPYERSTGKFGNETDAKTAQKILMDKGWTREQAAGIAGNLQAESGLKTTALGDNGKAKGIAQWHPDRQAQFEKLSGKKIEEASFEDQVNFVDWELKNTEKKAGEKLKTAKTAEDAAKLFEKHYERDAISSKGGYGKERVDYANKAMEMDLEKTAKLEEKTEEAKAIPPEKETAIKDPNVVNGYRIVPFKEPEAAKVEQTQTAIEESKSVNGYKDIPPKGNETTKVEEVPTGTKNKETQTAPKLEQKDGEYLNVAPMNNTLEKTATLENVEKFTSGDIITDVQNAPTQIQKAPDFTQDNLKKIVEQSNKPQQPIIVQQAATQPQPQQKPKTAPMLKVRNNDDPIWMWMQQELTKIV